MAADQDHDTPGATDSPSALSAVAARSTPSTPATPAISFHEVSFAYQDRLILDEITVDIPTGQLASIVGPNGGGKTTFLRLCLGLLRPQRGRIHILGIPPAQARRRIGYVPQHFLYDPQFPVTVLDVVLTGRLGHRRWGFYGPRDYQAANRALHDVDLQQMAQRPFAVLSGGQQQRVLIARALSTEPELLLLDEPTASVDAQSQQELFTLMRQLARQLTVVVVTHDMHLVSAAVDHVLCINRRLVLHPTSELPEGTGFHIHGESFRLVRHDRRLDDHESDPCNS